MTVQPAAKEDLEQLLALWQEAFGETKEEALPFFRENFPLCRPFTVKDGDTVCAMAYALPQTLQTDRSKKPVCYLYAVATKETFRGRGLASRLLTQMAQTLKDEGFAGLLLVPANPPLFDFYGKLGFLPFSFREKAEFDAAKWEISSVSPEEYLLRRQSLAPVPHNVPPAKVLEHLSLYAWEGGCAAAEQTAEGVILREALGDPRGIGAVIGAMGADRGTAMLPQGSTPYAVALPLCDGFPKEGYFAFAME